jgi:hypothetical protein
MLINLSQSCLDSVGATSAKDFPEKLAMVLNVAQSQSETITKLQSTLKALTDSNVTLVSGLEKAEAAIKAQSGQIALLEKKIGDPSLMTESAVREIATKAGEVAGSKEAMTALALTGAAVPPAPPSNVATAATGAVDGLIKAKKYEEAFIASPAGSPLRREFSDAKSYAAFMKFEKRGQTKITAKE